MSTEATGIVLRHSPYSDLLTQEALDCILALAALGQELTLFVLDDGVFAFLNEQANKLIERKSIEKQLAALDLYGVESVYFCEKSLSSRGLTVQDLSVEGTALTPQEMSKVMRQQRHLLSF